MTPAQIASIENDPRVIRNKAKIQATVQNAREVLAVLDSYGSIRAYLASFPDAHAAAADLRRRFKFLGDTGVWRLLASAARDIGGDSAASSSGLWNPTCATSRARPFSNVGDGWSLARPASTREARAGLRGRGRPVRRAFPAPQATGGRW
jgi:Methyladenine glycosylase